MDDVQFVLISFEDGGVGIMQFLLNPRLPPETQIPGLGESGREATDEAIQHEVDKSVFDRKVVGWRKISKDEVPSDRTYRNAWKDAGRSIGHDITKARELHRTILRQLRVPLLQQLDVDYSRADESGDGKAKKEIAAKKQALRDLPSDPRIEAAQTIEQLKQIGA